jgi:CHASE2 domain-containing sensor protein
VAYISAMIFGGVVLAPRSPFHFYIFVGSASAALLAICYAKGEPPKWRWG